MSDTERQTHELTREVRRWVEKAVGRGAKFVSSERLAGATSSVLDSVEVERQGRILRLVLRRFVDKEWLRLEPDLARHEAANLELASKARIPTPELVAFDERGEETVVPATLMTRLDGRVSLQPANVERWLHQMAEALMHIHQLDARRHNWSYFPYADLSSLQPPAWSAFTGLWEKALEIVTSAPRPPARESFIHRDYHPTNVLFGSEGVLSGVIDWVNSCRGPSAIDVIWCRQNLALLCGVEVADRFLSSYETVAGTSSEYHPFWDLMGLIEILPGPPEVYAGWPAFGVHHLNAQLLHERAEEYLLSVMARLAA